MNAPVSREELSMLLRMECSAIEALWRSGQLKRTVACAHRLSILHSSPFDLIEYWLSSSIAAFGLTRDQAAMWTLWLAEAAEVQGFLNMSFQEKLSCLQSIAEQESDAETTFLTRIAVRLIRKYEETLSLMANNDLQG